METDCAVIVFLDTATGKTDVSYVFREEDDIRGYVKYVKEKHKQFYNIWNKPICIVRFKEWKTNERI